MIVRNEAEVIQRCLGSVRGLIDHWVICDTGSNDGTQQLVRAALEGIPGDLHERPWADFGHNRTELMAFARDKADYLLLIDADMTISYDKAGPGRLSADSYMLRHAEEPEYWIKRLVRSDRRWWYVGATHEYLETDQPERVENLDAIVIHHHADGGSRHEKFERDARLLSAELEVDPTNARAVFYLAQTLRDMGRVQESANLYRRRAAMGGWPEEVFYSLYQLGVLTDRAGQRDRAIIALLDAWNYRPQRVEPLYELARMFRERQQYHPAHLVAQRGVHAPVPADALFLHRWIYQWGLLFEYSIAAYWVGQPAAALEACDRLLAMPDLPQTYREQTRANRVHCVRALDASPIANTTATQGHVVGLRRSTSSRTYLVGVDAAERRGVAITPILASMHQVEGWLTDEEAECLITIAGDVLSRFPSAHACVEIGSYCGRSTVVLASVVAQIAPSTRVYAIDPHDGELGAEDVGPEFSRPTFDRFRENMARAGVSPYVVPIRARSYELDWSEPVALLLIDGLHDYDNCARDFRHFEPWLARGGRVAFHDYQSWPGVTAFVDELAASDAYAVLERAGSLVVLERRRSETQGLQMT
jgi:glycosyltransferase involved in cell wall biosynthesis/predicted O-methyltransferase YrrM